MQYEAFLNSERVEFVEAESVVGALVQAAKLCENEEAPVYLRERESGDTVWTLLSLLEIK